MKFKFWRVVLLLPLIPIASICLWKFLYWALAADRGIDLTDEGLYLLAADPPEPYASYGFPFGWHTGVLFFLANFDIANFRTFGAFLLALVGLYLGYQVSLAAWNNLSGMPKPESGPLCKNTFLILGALVGLLSSLCYYAGLLRSPSYNWLALFGLCGASAGYIALLRFKKEDRRINLFFHLLFISFFLFITIPAKPSVAPMTMLWLGLVSALLLKNWLKSLKIFISISILILFWIFLAHSTGLWAPDFPRYFTGFFDPDMPRLSESYSLFGAVLSTILVPWEFLNKCLSSPAANLAWISCLTSILVIVFNVQKKFPAVLAVTVTSTVIACAFTAKIPNAFLNVSQPVERFIYSPPVTAILLIVFLIATLSRASSGMPWGDFFKKSKWLFLCIGFLGIPFIFAFGTGHPPYSQASMAMVFFFMAAIFSMSGMSRKQAFQTISILMIFSALMLASTLRESWKLPYRMAPMAMQTFPVEIGKNRSQIFLNPPLGYFMEKLKSSAIEKGWTGGTPILNIAWGWPLSLSYLIGGKVPNCLLITFWGLDNSLDFGKYISEKNMLDFPSNNAWVLSGDASAIIDQNFSENDREDFEKGERDQEELVNFIIKKHGLSFPMDYELVAEANSLKLWKPLKR